MQPPGKPVAGEAGDGDRAKEDDFLGIHASGRRQRAERVADALYA